MRALVISGGGSKGAFAGGVAQYLIEHQKNQYDMFLGTSTGSLLVSHLALGKLDEIYHAYTNVSHRSIFDNSPFLVYDHKGTQKIKMHHWNILKNFLRGKKTFGESNNLRRLLAREIPRAMFAELQKASKEIVICVSNLSLNTVEFKSVQEVSYEDYLDWIWISCNYVPFMSLVIKNKYEYADGGLGCVVAIEEAIRRGAMHIDAIVLTTATQQFNRMRSRNAFDLLGATFSFMLDRIERQNIKIGSLEAQQNNCTLALYHTPRVLTTNSLIFNRKEMEQWWQEGVQYAHKKHLPAN